MSVGPRARVDPNNQGPQIKSAATVCPPAVRTWGHRKTREAKTPVPTGSKEAASLSRAS